MPVLNTPPKTLGYMMPAEWKNHQGTIIELPYRADTWRENACPAIKVFLKLVKIISKYEKVYLLVDPKINEDEIEDFKLPNVEIIRMAYNDSWARDNTLIFVQKQGKNLAVDFRFNAWGGLVDGLYDDWRDDDKLGKKIAEYLHTDIYSLKDFILEGGSIHTNGEGTLLTTSACLLSKGRNASLNQTEIEEVLKETLGVKKVLWLEHGIYNDETNEHVDNMACFLDEHTIAVATGKVGDIQDEYSTKAIKYLEQARDAFGRPFTIVKIPAPILYLTEEEAKGLKIGNAINRPSGNRLGASYINFYQSDKFVIVPKFNVKEDEEAYQILKAFYPNKDVYQLDSREILLAGGNIHCVTMQIPKETKGEN